MVLWWIGNAILLLVILPVVIALLNRVLAAVERIRGAADEILTGGFALVGELGGGFGVPPGALVFELLSHESCCGVFGTHVPPLLID